MTSGFGMDSGHPGAGSELAGRAEVDDLLLFSRLILAAGASGLSVPRALGELAGKLPPNRARAWAEELAGKMARGHSLKEAVNSLRGLDPTLAGLLSVPGGFGFESLLTAYSRYILLFTKLGEKIRTVTLYPLILLWIGLGNLGLLNMLVFPAMQSLFGDQRQPLPMAVRLLFFGEPRLWPFSAIVPVFAATLALVATRFWFVVPPVEMPATLLGKLLLLGRVARAEGIGRSQFLIALFLRAGCRLTDAIRLAAGLGTGLRIHGLSEKAERLERGEEVACSLADDEVFRPICGGLPKGADPDEVAEVLEAASEASLADAENRLRQVESLGLVGGLIAGGAIVLTLTVAFFDPYFTLIRGVW